MEADEQRASMATVAADSQPAWGRAGTLPVGTACHQAGRPVELSGGGWAGATRRRRNAGKANPAEEVASTVKADTTPLGEMTP